MQGECGQVDQIEIGPHAGGDHAAIEQAVGACRVEGLFAHQPLDGQARPAMPVTAPVGQQEGWPAGIADRADMRATIADAHHRRRILEHGADHFQIAVGVVLEGMQQQPLAVVGHQQFEGDFPDRYATGCGPHADRIGGIRLVVGDGRHLEGPRQHAAEIAGGIVLGALVDQPAAQGGIGPQAGGDLGSLEARQRLAPGRMATEGIQTGFESEQHADAPAADLSIHIESFGSSGMDLVEGFTPEGR